MQLESVSWMAWAGQGTYGLPAYEIRPRLSDGVLQCARNGVCGADAQTQA